jgi:nucleoside-diphosphate-sugar epimerase
VAGRLLVTGGTGLTGSTIALLAARQGRAVRALVRGPAQALADAGVETVRGDITDPGSLDAAMAGVTEVINTAAVLGGTWATASPEQMWAVNHDGALNVLDAAARAGVRRCVHLDTNAIWDASLTLTERSALVTISGHDSPYVAAKRAAFAGALHRAARGQDIVFVTPGAIYGPGAFADRALDPTSFTRLVQRAVLGELDAFVTYPLTWTFVPDLAEIALRALDRGEPGRRYLAMGRPQDVSSLAAFCNEAASIAGVAHRVRDVDPLAPDAPDVGSMAQFTKRLYATPLVDPSVTTKALGYQPTPRADGLAQTVGWLRAQGKL